MSLISLIFAENSFKRQLEQFRPKLLRVAFSWSHDAALAEDLVQETILKALKYSGQLRDPAALRSWLFSIMNNCWRDHFRQKVEMADISQMEDHYKTDFTPEDEHAKAQVASHVWNAVAKLPMGQRQVLTLVDLEELTYIEVANILSIPIGTVMSRLSRARQTLKVLLKELAPQKTAHTAPLRRVV